jgi:hypothetical protein
MKAMRLKLKEKLERNVKKKTEQIKEEQSIVQKDLGEQKLPFKARLLMGPVRMYRTYNLFPWAFLFHILLVVFTSFEVIYINRSTHMYSRDARISLFYFMLNKDIGVNDFFYDRNVAYYSIDDMRQ